MFVILLTLLPQVSVDPLHEDKLVWIPSKDGEFSIRSTYHALRTVKPRVGWARLIWFKGRIPKHSFITWFALRNALKTRSRLHFWGISPTASCLFCSTGIETESHLFSECSYGRQIWGLVTRQLGFSRQSLGWADEVLWCIDRFVGCLGTVQCLLFCSFVYHLWCERNRRLHDGEELGWSQLYHLILRDVRERVGFLRLEIDDNDRNRQVIQNIRLDVGLKIPQAKQCSWVPPDTGWVMVNTDGSLQAMSAGIGVCSS